MISIKYEIYHNDYNRRYEDKSFRDLREFKDWMFGLMHQPYVNEKGLPNMHFLDGVVKGRFSSMDSSSRISIRPEWGGDDYWIYCVSDNNKIVFTNGKYTNGQCYISEGFKAFLRECMDRRDGKEQVFEFGEIEGYAPPVVKSVWEQAAELVAQNPELAEAVFYTVQKENERENIVKRIKENSDFHIEDFTEQDLDELGERFGNAICSDQAYLGAYWEIADECIEEFSEEKEIAKPALDESIAEAEQLRKAPAEKPEKIKGHAEPSL